ncbi:hypothetical protein AAC387_Pa06g2021 [Persea americana]
MVSMNFEVHIRNEASNFSGLKPLLPRGERLDRTKASLTSFLSAKMVKFEAFFAAAVIRMNAAWKLSSVSTDFVPTTLLGWFLRNPMEKLF